MERRLDPDAVERILRRAHEMDGAPTEGGSGVEAEALVEAATEVGIDPNAVRDSLAMERFVAPDPTDRRLDGVAGPDRVVVEREMRLTVDDALEGIETWLHSVYRLACDRRSETTLFARRRTDTAASISRSFASLRGEGRLDARKVFAEAVPRIVGSSPVEPRCIVRVTADRSLSRSLRLGGGASLGAGGVGVGTAAAVAQGLVIFPIVAAPLAVGGYVIARSGRSESERVELEIERLLSRVDRGERPEKLMSRVAKRARGAVATERRR